MLQVSNEQQIKFLIYSVLVGVLLSFVYDFFKMLRKLFEKTPDTVIFIEDLIFSIICTVFYIVFIYAANLGIPRLFSAIGAAVGFAVWYFTFGKILPTIYVKLISVIALPVKLIFGSVVKISAFLIKKFAICEKNFKKLFIFAKKRNIIYLDVRNGRIFKNF